MHVTPRLTAIGKYFEVRYFLNVIVGSTHTSAFPASLSPIKADRS